MNTEELRQKVEDSENGFYPDDIKLLVELVSAELTRDSMTGYQPRRTKRLQELKRKFTRLLDMLSDKPEPDKQ